MVTALKLPPNPTAEQFGQAEPLVVQYIVESQYIDGIMPLQRAEADPQDNQYVMDGPGQYSGIFTDIDGDLKFRFNFGDDGVSYEPLNPEAIADDE